MLLLLLSGVAAMRKKKVQQLSMEKMMVMVLSLSVP
jgi:hypothetical protein